MSYIVMDMEWNQAMSAKSSIFNKLPIHLQGEIIQIGAVKLTGDMQPGEEFQIDIRPEYFKKMHYKVKKLTGFDTERLSNGVSFHDAMKKFRTWCGDGCTFLTWGYDDKGIMEQNIIIHDLEWGWIDSWVNLQLIFNQQTGGNKNQKALSKAMEHFGIEQTRVAHDALGDAYNTALVASKMDLVTGLEQYNADIHDLPIEENPAADGGDAEPAALAHTTFKGFASKNDIFADSEVPAPACPICGQKLKASRWISQGDKRYMSMLFCENHGSFLVRLKLKENENDTWTANRIIYEATPKLKEYYKKKSAIRRRKRSRKATNDI